jgi:hypothetical protein
MFSQVVQHRILYLLGLIAILFVIKPRFFFKPNGKPRLYGLGYDHEGYKKTLYTVQFIVLVLAILLTLFKS